MDWRELARTNDTDRRFCKKIEGRFLIARIKLTGNGSMRPGATGHNRERRETVL
jgi:hypothetical protein